MGPLYSIAWSDLETSAATDASNDGHDTVRAQPPLVAPTAAGSSGVNGLQNASTYNLQSTSGNWYGSGVLVRSALCNPALGGAK